MLEELVIVVLLALLENIAMLIDRSGQFQPGLFKYSGSKSGN